MAVSHKLLGQVSVAEGTELVVQIPAMDIGDYAVLYIGSLVSGIATPSGWTVTGPPLADDNNAGAVTYTYTFWKYAATAQLATSATVTFPQATNSLGYIKLHTGAANAAPQVFDNREEEFVAYWRTAAITTAAPLFMTSGTMLWNQREFASFRTEGTISVNQTIHYWETAFTYLSWIISDQNIVSASGGRAGANVFADPVSTVASGTRSLAIPAATQSVPTNTVSYWDGVTETPLTDKTFRYTDQGEHGFWYGGNTVSYWDGTREIPIDITPGLSTSPLAGVAFTAYGDSYGVVQSGGGVNYVAADLYVSQMAARLGATVTNRNVNSFMAMDVASSMNASDSGISWVPGSSQSIVVHVGGNDLKHYNSAAGLAGYKHSLSAIIGITRSASRSIASTASVTGSWSAIIAGSSGGARLTTTPGATLTFSFSGNNATLFLLAPRDGTGAALSYKVDGGMVQYATTLAQMAANPSVSGAYGVVPVHIRDIGQGEHTVVITHAGSGGQPLIVDSIGVWFADLQQAPYLLISGAQKPDATVLQQFMSPTPSKIEIQQFIDRFEAVLRDTATVPKVSQILVNAYSQTFWKRSNEAIFIDDGYHPNKAGHDILADIMYEGALRAFE